MKPLAPLFVQKQKEENQMPNSNRPKNALSHGVYASDVVLDWENEQDFKDLLENLRAEFCPNGVSEEDVVFDIASLMWKKRRLNVGSQLAFHRHPDAGALVEAGQRGGWSGVAEYLKTNVGDGDRMFDAIRAMTKSHAVTFGKACALMDERLQSAGKSAGQQGQSSDQESRQRDSAELQDLITLAKELNVTTDLLRDMLHLIENYDLDQKACERAYRPEVMERELKIRAELDKRIEKAIQRLVTTKEYKKFYGADVIEAQHAEVVSLPAKSRRRSKEG
jgi:hypothetical protein